MFTFVLAASLPFIAAGIILTSRRLQSARLPLWLNVLFFVPVINLVFFTMLCAVPARDGGPGDSEAAVAADAGTGSRETVTAIAAPVVTVVLGTALCMFDVYALGVYGFGLFIGLPFCLGMVAALILGLGGVRGGATCDDRDAPVGAAGPSGRAV